MRPKRWQSSAMRSCLASLAVTWLLFIGPAACACSCFYATPDEHFERSDFVFTGLATSVYDPATETIVDDWTNQPLEYTFEVESVEKGEVQNPARVLSDRSEAACGYPFRVGERYQVFGSFDDQGRMWTSLCSGNRYLTTEGEGPDEPGPSPKAKATSGPKTVLPSPAESPSEPTMTSPLPASNPAPSIPYSASFQPQVASDRKSSNMMLKLILAGVALPLTATIVLLIVRSRARRSL